MSFTVKQEQLLGDVTDLKAKPGGAGQVVLNWRPGANATAHLVYYRVIKGSWKLWSSTLARKARGTTVTGLTAGTKYQFVVRAVRGKSGSKWIFAYATAGQEQPPGNATNLTAAPGPNAGEVTLTWTPGARATVHRIVLKKEGGKWWLWSSRPAGNAIQTTITGLDPGHRYYFSVRACRETQGSEVCSSWWKGPNDYPSAVASHSPMSQDRAALVVLYNQTGGPEWKNEEKKWLIDNPRSPIGSWHGVTTNSDGRVTRLDLQSNGLRGQIPSELGNLENLTHLNLSHNDLGGGTENIDNLTWLVELSNLTHLDLSHNRRGGNFGSYRNALGIKGQFPLALASNEKLTHINISNNLFENNLDALLEAFSKRDPGSEFHLNVSHNTWTASGATRELSGWVGDLVVAEAEFTEYEYLALMTLYNQTKSNIDGLKVKKDIVKNILKDKNGKAVYGIAQLVCGENEICSALSGTVSDIKGLYSQAQNAKNAAGKVVPIVTLYYDATIFSNPLVEDLMVSAVVGWINGWTTEQVFEHYLSRFDFYEKAKVNTFAHGHANACSVSYQQHKQWCDICKPFQDDIEKNGSEASRNSGLISQKQSWFTTCLCTIPNGFRDKDFPNACPNN